MIRTSLMFAAAVFGTVDATATHTSTAAAIEAMTLFDFSKPAAVEGWVEVSDTVREVGKSKAAFVPQQTQLFCRAVLFALLNPQENGACFAGVRAELRQDLARYDGLALNARATGLQYWKVILRTSEAPDLSYEAFFGGEEGQGGAAEPGRIVLLFDRFEAIFRGAPVPDAPPLDLSRVVSLGLQTYGGVYNGTQQSGE